ncbi:MAG: hypothetical protein COV66_10515 [Nitrospinae bacterium CG11_big_fil_rev_8_21_14_0_20_45_15]|nr:MAG: hypothetical protein COV66_10515 [Nitrospinae bacterium CG11_big_fil_rev_8_21_14_0_20_45_15]
MFLNDDNKRLFQIVGFFVLLFALGWELEINVPSDVSTGVLYLALAGFAYQTRNRNYILTAAAMAISLEFIGYFKSPQQSTSEYALASLIIAICIITITTQLFLKRNQSEKELHAIQEHLHIKQIALNLANTAYKRETTFVQLHKDIAVAANEAGNIEETLKLCLKRICHHTGWPVGHLYLPESRNSSYLLPTTIWYLEHPESFKNFKEISETTAMAPGEGLPGRVLKSGKPEWIIDVGADPNFPRSRLAKDINVKAGFAFPIFIGEEIAGVMEFFSSQAVEPNPQLLDIMSQIGAQLGRIFERKYAEEEINDSQEKLRNLYHRLQSVREEERTRIAREVHDELAQILTAIKFKATLLEKKLVTIEPDLTKYTQAITNLVSENIKIVKKIVMDLRPPILDDFGISEAIEWQINEFATNSGIECSYILKSKTDQWDKEKATALFRIFQEALTNVARHSQAKNLQVELEQKNGIFKLTLKDDGIGITTHQITDPTSLGILGMRERATPWCGNINFESAAGEGTLVTIVL